MMEGPGADSEEKHEPVSDIDTAVVVVGLKALDPEWPIREAIGKRPGAVVRPHRSEAARSHQALISVASMRMPFACSMNRTFRPQLGFL